MQNELIGRKVIVRSNEDHPFWIGTLKRFNQWGWPVVEDDDGQVMFCGGVVIPYTEEMETFLNTLTSLRQWEILRGISVGIQAIMRGAEEARRENQEEALRPAAKDECLTCKQRFSEKNPDGGDQVCQECWDLTEDK